MKVHAIDHLVLTVSDVAVSCDWYERVLATQRRASPAPGGGPDRISVTFGVNKINLRPTSASQDEWFTGTAPQPGSGDLCFLTDETPAAVVAHLDAQGVPIVLGPVTKQGAQGDICSVYVRDPDGNLIEISSYIAA